MRANGIIRRIDDLGRVVIPKEIRRTIGIREGEPLEIFLDNMGGQPVACFRKYENNLSDAVEHLRYQIENCGDDLAYKTLMRIDALLEEVQELVKGEE